jgi:uncharacterized membrane protein YadS
VIPAAVHPGIARATTLLITVALAGVGLSIDLGARRRTGRPLVFGAILWLVVSATSLGLQALTTGL